MTCFYSWISWILGLCAMDAKWARKPRQRHWLQGRVQWCFLRSCHRLLVISRFTQLSGSSLTLSSAPRRFRVRSSGCPTNSWSSRWLNLQESVTPPLSFQIRTWALTTALYSLSSNREVFASKTPLIKLWRIALSLVVIHCLPTLKTPTFSIL